MNKTELLKTVDELIQPVSGELEIYNIDDFLGLNIPDREDILAPIIKTQSLNMLFAKRGIGKTHIALGISYAIASGGNFLNWKAPEPRRIVYIDGEMPACSWLILNPLNNAHSNS